MARGDQLARQWKIFQALVASRRGKSVADLADVLECHQRTVYRDLDALEAAGFPIYSETANGRNLWRLMDSARNPMPVPFTLSELLALHFSSDALRAFRGTVFHDALASVLKKVKASIPPESAGYLRRVAEGLHSRSGPHKNYAGLGDIVEQVNEAVMTRRVIEIVYYTQSRRKETRRKIAPYRIWFHNGDIYVVGHCRWRKEIRVFALDRIREVTLTGERFVVPDEFDVDEFMRAGFGAYHGNPVRLRVLFSAEAADYVGEKTWHETQKLRHHPDGSVLFEADVACTEEVKAWVLRWGRKAVVLEPDELRDAVRSEAAEMLAVYANGLKRTARAMTA